jgi:hypothetical protein
VGAINNVGVLVHVGAESIADAAELAAHGFYSTHIISLSFMFMFMVLFVHVIPHWLADWYMPIADSIGVWAIAAIPPTFFKPANTNNLVAMMARIAAAAPRTPCMHIILTHIMAD